MYFLPHAWNQLFKVNALKFKGSFRAIPWQYTRPDVLFWTVKNGRLHAVTKEAKVVQAKKGAIYGYYRFLLIFYDENVAWMSEYFLGERPETVL